MSIPDSILTFLLENLTQVIKDNVSLIAGVKDEIAALQKELGSLRDLMNDYAKYNRDSDFIKGLTNRIREIMYEIEDAVDTHLIQAAEQKSGLLRRVKRNVWDQPLVLRKIGKKIEQINIEVQRIYKQCVDQGTPLLNNQEIRSLGDAAKSKEDPPVEKDHVIGFEGAIETVAKLVAEGAEHFEAISILGMLGLGKTTLAWKVFNDPKVTYEYMNKAFVYISKVYDKKEVFYRILTSIHAEVSYDVDKATVNTLEEHLRKELSGKSYFIVLDDIWEKTDWDELKGAFPDNANERCRVLVTTRDKGVANVVSTVLSHCYELDFLTRAKSEELLRWKVFRDGEFPDDVEVHKSKILDKCDGLPLAIVVISGILCNYPRNPDHWMDVAMGVETYSAKDAKKIIDVVGLMYKHLPYNLKRCFLYMGVFKEDFEIPVWKLLRLWMAEGLIKQERRLELEDVAWRVLNELVRRNIVMVASISSNEKVKTCRMHDSLRDFCKKEAREEDFFGEINEATSDTYRRFCCSTTEAVSYISKPQPAGKCVRSFLTFDNKDPTPISAQNTSSLPKTFKLLRVMEVQSILFSKFPTALCSLVLLKYVAISSHFSKLPSHMSKMWNLQTLIVNTTEPTLDILANIWDMQQLRHLHTNASALLPQPDPKTSNESITSIQTLSTISPQSCTRGVFIRTPGIRKLGIRGTRGNDITKHFKDLFGILGSLTCLENLKLLNNEMSLSSVLPLTESFPKQLTKLTLENTGLEWDQMRTLGELCKLKVLKLNDHAFRGESWVSGDGFLNLVHLHIGQTGLKSWEVASGVVSPFPKLRRLQLHNCDKLQGIPNGFNNTPRLVAVNLHHTNASLVASAKRLEKQKHELAKNDNNSTTFHLSVYPPETSVSH